MNYKLFSVFLALGLLLLIGFNALMITERFEYSLNENGIDYFSNQGIVDWFESASERNDFVVVVSMNAEEDLEINSYMAVPVTMFNSVLPLNGKNSIVLVKAYGKNNELVSCQTDWGKVKENTTLSAEECNAVLASNDSNMYVEFFFPNPAFPNPKIILEENKARIYPKSRSDIQTMSFDFLNGMFLDAEDAINAVNDLKDDYQDSGVFS